MQICFMAPQIVQYFWFFVYKNIYFEIFLLNILNFKNILKIISKDFTQCFTIILFWLEFKNILIIIIIIEYFELRQAIQMNCIADTRMEYCCA